MRANGLCFIEGVCRMKKSQSEWWQPEGWMRFGSVVAVLLLVGFLIFLVVGFFLPRLRKIGKIYNSASAGRSEARPVLPPGVASGPRA